MGSNRAGRTAKVTRRDLLTAGAAATMGAAAGACGFPYLMRAGKPTRNIFLLVVDALRADYLGRKAVIGGRERSLTPFLDEFCRKGMNYRRAIAPSSWTPISMGAILGMTSPFNVYYYNGLIIESKQAGMAEMLRAKGYRTIGAVSNPVLDNDTVRQGFDDITFPKRWNDGKGEMTRDRKETGGRTNGVLLKKLKRSPRKQPVFAYWHSVDNHDQYTARRELVRAMGCGWNGNVSTSKVRGHFRSGRWEEASPATGLTFADNLRHLRVYYEAAVRHTDNYLQALVRNLERGGWLRDSLIILTSDHGEEFADADLGDWRGIAHGYNLTLAETHVPLVVWGSGESGEELSPVSSSDVIGRTVTDFIEGRTDSRPWPGEAVSHLDWEGHYHGTTLTVGNHMFHKRTEPGGGGEVFKVSSLSRGEAVEVDADVSSDVIGKIADLEERKPAKARDQRMDDSTLETMRVLGYLN